MDEIKYKDGMIKIIEIFFPHAKVYLFGSYARGTNKPGSDIDIANRCWTPSYPSRASASRTTP